MASPLEQLNRSRSGVTVYAPTRRLPPAATGRTTPQRKPTASDVASATALATQAVGRIAPSIPGAASDPLFNAVMSTPEAQAQRQQVAQKAATEQAKANEPFWQKALGYVIAPLEPLSVPMKIVQTGLEEGVKLLPDSAESWMSHPFGKNAKGVGGVLNTLAPLVGGIFGQDMAKTHDNQSVWDRIKPSSSYGAGQVYGNDSKVPGVTGLRNLLLDIEHDPLTYLTFGAGGAADAGVHVAEAGAKVALARDALEQAPKILEETGKVNPAIKDLEQALSEAQKAEKQASKIKDLPHSRQGRMGMISELAASGAEGEAKVAEHATEFSKGVNRGFTSMSQEAKDALGVTKSGLRLRGTGAVLPGTGKLAEIASLPGQLGREGLGQLSSKLEGSSSKILAKLGEGRTPEGLGEQYRTMRSTSATADQKLRALVEIHAENLAHTTQNIVEGGAKNAASQAVRPILKMNATQKAALVEASEKLPEMTPLNDTIQKVAQVYAEATGRPIQDVVTRDAATHVPHIQTDEWFTFREGLSDEAKKDLGELTGITTKDTLKTSGNMDSRRMLTLDGGAPKSFKVGDRMVTVTDDGIHGLNKAFAEAFPEFKGKVYEDDPLKIVQGYIKAVSTASRRWSLNKLGGTGSSFATSITGDLADELAARNEALAGQSREARLAEAANQPRVEGQRAPAVAEQPIVPGSPRDQLNRAFNEQLPELQSRATTPGAQEQLDALASNYPPQSTPAPSGMFRNVESTTAPKRLAEQLLTPEATANEAALRGEAVATAEASQKTLGDLRSNMWEDVRKEGKDVDKKLDKIDQNIQSYKTQLEGFRSVRSNNPEQIEQMLEATSKNVVDLEAELAKKTATWKGLGTKAANKAERRLKDQYEQLKQIRDEARTALGEQTSSRIAAEVDKRTGLLLAPVKAAEERLAAKTLSIPAPFKQGVLDTAAETLEKAGLSDQHWQAYGQVLAERPRNAALPITAKRVDLEAQRELDMAAHRLTGGEVTPYIKAQGEATVLQNMIPDASGAQARRMKDHLAEINKKFAPGGEFFEERKARSVMAQQLEHEQVVKASTQRERDTLARAREAVGTRQEAIVRDARGNRILSDSAGLAEGTERKITPIQNTPQVEASQDVYPGTRGKIKALPPQRTEREAIAAVAAQANPGSEVHKATVTATTQAVEDFEANMPTMTGEVRAAALRDIGGQADEVLGPISSELKTMKGLTTDLGNKQQLLARRTVNDNLVARLEKAQVGKADLPSELLKKARELQLVARQNPRLDDLSLAATESLLHNEVEQLTLAGEKLNFAQELAAAQKAARDGSLPKVMVAGLHDGWVTIHGGLVQAGDTVIDKQLWDSFNRVTEAVNNPKLFTRTFNNLTNLWKTFATLSPGFHVRNALGGIFMNLSDGVGFKHQLEAIGLFRELREGGAEWLGRQDERVQQAVSSMFASGAGGQFEEAGMRNGLANNSLTRASRKAGEYVEGPLRLAMGLHSYDRGDTLMQAYERINRIHFDYSRVSQMDQSMKRIVPFWTFMSRNLPLQMTQMWTKPAAYAFYGHVKRNFSVPNDPLTPEYWGKLGAWNTGLKFKGMPLYLDPDFGFNRVESDASNVTDAIMGGNPGALLSNVNPLLSAPLDFLMKRDSFYDRSFKPTDFSEQSGINGAFVKALAHLVPGQTNEAGQVSDNFTNLISSLIPVYDRSVRLSGGNDPQRIPESWARFAGAPVRTLSDKQKESAALSKFLDAQAEQRRQAAMLREAG